MGQKHLIKQEISTRENINHHLSYTCISHNVILFTFLPILRSMFISELYMYKTFQKQMIYTIAKVAVCKLPMHLRQIILCVYILKIRRIGEVTVLHKVKDQANLASQLSSNPYQSTGQYESISFWDNCVIKSHDLYMRRHNDNYIS